MSTHLRHLRILALVALALGVIADLLFYRRMPGISIPLFVGLCLLALVGMSRAEGLDATPANRWLGPAALFFAALTAIRAEPTLTVLNGGAALSLLLLQIALFRGASLPGLPGGQYLLRMLIASAELSVRPAPIAIGVAGATLQRGDHLKRLFPIGRGLALAVPVLGVFTLLLMMADEVFASYVTQVLTLQVPLLSADTLAQAMIVFGIGWASAGALLTALRPEFEAEPQPAAGKGWLGCVEALTVLVLLDLLFVSFMVIQAAYLFGGLDTLSRTGMTYADYARRGFFELVAVACLALGFGWLLARVTRRDQSWQMPAFNGANAMLILLVLGLLGSAFQRMWLYEQAYGFTHLRLYTHTFMVWLALLLLLFLAALLAERPRWFSFGGLISALVVLAALTLADPETLIVRANIARYQQTGELGVGGPDAEPFEESYGRYRPSRTLDAGYLARLSSDATPALVEALPTLDTQTQAEIRAGLVEQRAWLEQVQRESGWPAWHLARVRALAALQALGG